MRTRIARTWQSPNRWILLLGATDLDMAHASEQCASQFVEQAHTVGFDILERLERYRVPDRVRPVTHRASGR